MCINIINAHSLQSIQTECQKHSCMIVIDAGSTGSRLHLYAYDQEIATLSADNIQELYVRKINPGIASIPLTEIAINNYLSNLLRDLTVDNIPIYFYATGGMRLHPKILQDRYFTLLANWFKQHQEYRVMDLRVISGNEEGVFGWLAVNEILGRLSGNNQSLVGLLDLGGASTQLVFPINNISYVAPEDLQHVNIAGQDVVLFVHSFLGLGSTEVLNRFKNQSSCMPKNYPMDKGLTGEGDAYTCATVLTKNLNNDYKVQHIVQQLVQSNSIESWYTLGTVSAMTKKPPFLLPRNEFSAKSLFEQGNQEICNMQWPDLQIRYPNDSYMQYNCLISAYYYALTVNGYGINAEQKISTMPSETETDWTLGVLVALVLS
jgi:hypothetical protein